MATIDQTPLPTADTAQSDRATETSPADPPKFEQTMAGLLNLLASLPRDGAVTNAVLRDWLLPLFEDARDEYHALAAENAEEIAAVAEDAAGSGEPDEGSKQVVMSLVGLVALVLQRARWMDDKLTLTPLCPKDLADEFGKVQTLVQAWANGVDIAAVMAVEQEG